MKQKLKFNISIFPPETENSLGRFCYEKNKNTDSFFGARLSVLRL